MGHLNNEELICLNLAKHLAGKDWHKLCANEKNLVADLKRAGWIKEKEVPDGFVGKAQVPERYDSVEAPKQSQQA